MVSPLIAARAYAAVQNVGLAKPAAGAAATAEQGADFAQMVKTAMNDVVSSSKQAEVQMAAQSQGKGELVDVVTAVASAQASLQTMLSVRDQAISAYQQIMSMPI